MSTFPIILKDNNFKENNIQFSLEHVESITTDDIKNIYFKLFATYEDSSIEKEIVLFEEDIQNLSIDSFTNNSPDYFFIEPDFWLTLIKVDQKEFILYINFDSGLHHSQMATESGFSLRMNISKDSFNVFLNNFKSYI